MTKLLAAIFFLSAGVSHGAVITSGYLNEATYAKDPGSFSITLSDGFHLEGYIAPLDYPGPGELVRIHPSINNLNTPYRNSFQEYLVSGHLEIDNAGFVSGSLSCPYGPGGFPLPGCELPGQMYGFEVVTGYGAFTGNTFTFAPEPSTVWLLALPVGWLLARRRLAA